MLRRPRALDTTPIDPPPAAAAPPDPEPVRIGELVVDPLARKAWLAGRELALTRTEFDLLLTLAQRPRVAFSRRQPIDEV